MVGDLECDSAIAESFLELPQADVNDSPECFEGEPLEDDERVDSIQELGGVLRRDYIHNRLLDVGVDITLWGFLVGMEHVVSNENLCSEIRRQDDDGVFEVDFVSLGI